MAATFTVRMGCDNCGYIGFYQVPRGHEIDDSDRDEGIFSSYHRHDSELRTVMYCANCAVPYLKVFWQEDNEQPAKVSQP